MSNEYIADWAEGLLIRLGKTSLPLSSLEGELKTQFSINQRDASFVIQILSRRSKLLKEKYPFNVGNLAIKVKPNFDEIPYTTLISLSIVLSEGWCAKTKEIPRNLPELFEEISCDAMIRLLGEGSCGLRFGWPSSIGRPREFPAAISWLAKKMKIRIGNSYRPPKMKDGGVDVVAWRPFIDGNPGFPILLGQVTIEKDFEYKADDIDLRIWAGWLSLDIEPTVVLAVPWTEINKEVWLRVSSRALLLDRIRIASLLPKTFTTEEWPDYLDRCDELVKFVRLNFTLNS